MKLYVDNREEMNSEKKRVAVALLEEGIDIEYKKLDVGDYLFEDEKSGISFCVERKEIAGDFVPSVYNKRLKKQLLQMNESYDRSYLVLIGNFKKLQFKRKTREMMPFTVNQRIGVLASILVRYPKVKLCFVDNATQFALLLRKLIEKSTDGKVADDGLFIKRMRVDDSYTNILCSFPLMGRKKARTIMEKYPTFPLFLSAVRTGTLSVPGIGETGLTHFKKVLLEK